VSKNPFDLSGKVALITGANSGLGLSYAQGLAKAGADLIIWGRNAGKNAVAVEKLKAHGGRVASAIVDVSVEAEVVAGMAAAIAEFGRLDTVIANAGFSTMSPFHLMPSSLYHDMLGTAQHGAFYTLREAARHMIARGEAGDPGGNLIISGSLTIFAGAPTMAHYGAAKGALNAMSKAMALELGPHGIRVNVIAPGFIITEMIEKEAELAKPIIAMVEAKAPMRRCGRPEDFEGIVVYLASDAASYHTGDTIVIDGGQMASVF
jgi:NAD(P)-dependent dehydrogenase (short-subunit alcohol dehydrogenase family)